MTTNASLSVPCGHCCRRHAFRTDSTRFAPHVFPDAVVQPAHGVPVWPDAVVQPAHGVPVWPDAVVQPAHGVPVWPDAVVQPAHEVPVWPDAVSLSAHDAAHVDVLPPVPGVAGRPAQRVADAASRRFHDVPDVAVLPAAVRCSRCAATCSRRSSRCRISFRCECRF